MNKATSPAASTDPKTVGGMPSVVDAVRSILAVPVTAERSDDGVWSVPGASPQPALLSDRRSVSLLESSTSYDDATAELVRWTSAEYLQRVEENRWTLATFSDAAKLLAAVLKLEQQVEKADAIQAKAKAHLLGLHDRRTPEAIAIEKRLNGQIALIREQFEKQSKRYEILRVQCQQSAAQRQQDARKAGERSRDQSTMADVEETLKSLLDISNAASGIVRSSRLATGGTDIPDQ